MLVSAWSQGLEAQYGFHHPEFNSPGQLVSSPKSFGSKWENSVEGLYLLAPPLHNCRLRVSRLGQDLQNLGAGSWGVGDA